MREAERIVLFIVTTIIIILIAFVLASQPVILESQKAKEMRALVESSSPLDTSLARKEVLLKVDEFAISTFPFSSILRSVYSSEFMQFFHSRITKAISEIRAAKVPAGKVRVWYLYNMGVVAKSANITIGFDIGGTWLDPSIGELSKDLDVLVITHNHADHFDPAVVKGVLQKGGIVIFPGEKVSIREITSSDGLRKTYLIDRDENGIEPAEALEKIYGISPKNVVFLKSGETVDIRGVRITSYAAKHYVDWELDTKWEILRNTSVSWFYVNISNRTILHTGDGYLLYREKDYERLGNMPIDIMIIHYPDDRALEKYSSSLHKVKRIVPLHLYEFGHGLEEVSLNMRYKQALENYDNWKLRFAVRNIATNISYTPMIWGEHIDIG
ncbi:MAG: MBL fold metallo-hydrolase [Candidatus Micrarchaeia archaeon]